MKENKAGISEGLAGNIFSGPCRACQVPWRLMGLYLAVLLILLGCDSPEPIKTEISGPKSFTERGGRVKTFLMIHSYHKDWGWSLDTEKGIREGLKRRGYRPQEQYRWESFFMDTKVTFTTEEQIRQRARLALQLIEKTDPDMVFINDDAALEHVAVVYRKLHPDSDLPFLFSGINSDPDIYPVISKNKKPLGPVTGALERFPFHQAFSLAHEILPARKKIVMLGDNSPSTSFVVEDFKSRVLEKPEGSFSESSLEVETIVQVGTFRQWQKVIADYRDKTDFFGIFSYHQLAGDNGEVVEPRRVVAWTVANSQVPEVGFLLFHCEDGFWMSVGVSPYKTGIYIGERAAEIFSGVKPAEIPIRDPMKTDIAFNIERTKMLGINVPIDILNMATAIYLKIGEPRF